MRDAFVHKSGGKRCVFCKHWYDPTNSAISPKNTVIGLWNFDEKTVKLCTKRNINKRSVDTCAKFESKM